MSDVEANAVLSGFNTFARTSNVGGKFILKEPRFALHLLHNYPE
jgi:hypothetical protein